MFGSNTEFNISTPDIHNVKVNRLKLPYHKNKEAEDRILFIFDTVHRSDYRQSKLLSGLIGDFMKNADAEAKRMTGKSMTDFQVFTLNLRYATEARDKTTDEEDEESTKKEENSASLEATIENINTRRVREFIKQAKPTRIVAFGRQSFNIFKRFYVEKFYEQASFTNLLGVPVPVKVGKVEADLFPMLNPNWLCVYNDSRDPYLIGYFTRCLANVYAGKLRYDSKLKPEDIKIRFVDTIKKFDKMLDHLMKVEAVAIDTETDNLNRIANRICTIQFADSAKSTFVLPMYHFETPFNAKELEYIKSRLYDFFMENENIEHLYQNANFDLPVIRTAFGLPIYRTPIWDVQAGEYALDENVNGLASVSGGGYYNLGNISIQYGFYGYISGNFGKEDRAGISKASLKTEGLLEYCAYDVGVLHAVKTQQLRRAKDEKHGKYVNVVRRLIGDTIHVFSTMNTNGMLIDKDYLWWLASPKSPIIEEVAEMENAILTMPEVKKAEALIRKDNHIPSKGLFGKKPASLFSLRKREHLQTLFFKVLKLEPVAHGSSGPSIGSSFLSTYPDNEAVAAYSNLTKAKKIRDAFIKAIIRIVSSNEDAKVDGRIRPFYSYLKIVTGRTSASDPNTQQIPSRGKLSNYIKRIFIAEKGTVVFKFDYSAHEVRGWALISGDKALSKTFQAGIDLDGKYKRDPTPENLKRFKEEGDIHIINSSHFYGISLAKVTKDIRHGVKAVTFGLIYGRSPASIASAVEKDVDFINDVIKKFFARFKVAAQWLLDIEKKARKDKYVEAPTGLRRHLYPYLLPNTKETKRDYEWVAAACDRRARNSPIQGMSSGIGYAAARYLEEWTYNRFPKYAKKWGKLPIRIQNMVHDSTENEVDYSHIIYATEMIQEAMVKGVQSKCEELFDMKFPVDLAIDIEIGATLDTVQAWDGSINELHRILEETFTYQKEKLGHNISVKREMRKVFRSKMSPMLQGQIDRGYFEHKDKYIR